MKKLTSAILVVSMLALLTGCTNENTGKTDKTSKADKTEKTEDSEKDPDDSGNSGGSSSSNGSDESEKDPGEPEKDPSTVAPHSGNEYLAITPDFYKHEYIIYRGDDGVWRELLEGKDLNVVGEYDNKLYYANTEGFMYLDLTAPDAEPTKWVQFKQLKGSSEDAFEYPVRTAMIGDTIYFEYATNAGGSEPTDGIMELHVSDDSMDDAKQLFAEALPGCWRVNEEEGVLYYLVEEVPHMDGTLFRYDPATRSSVAVNYGIHSFLNDGDTLLLVKNGDLYYDGGGMELILLDFEDEMTGGTIIGAACMHNGDVYYKQGNRIMKWSNGTAEIFCEYDGDNLYGFLFMNGDSVELILQDEPDEYLAGDNIYSDISQVDSQAVIMLDGSTQYFAFYP